jgi:hypothetical protein
MKRNYLMFITYTFNAGGKIVRVTFKPCKDPGWRFSYECGFLLLPSYTESGTFNGAANRVNASKIIRSFLIDADKKPLGS